MQASTSYSHWIGLDVSRDSFTAACKSIVPTEDVIYPEQDKFDCTVKGVRALLRWAGSLVGELEFGIAMEATGIYSRKLAKLIRSMAPDQHVAVCNPASVSFYVRSFSDEKNDKADAAHIARYACDRNPPPPREMDGDEEKLREVARERNRLVVQNQALGNARETIEDKELLKIHDKLSKAYAEAIGALEKKIAGIVNSSEKIKAEVMRMCTAPGVGFLSAACIYAELGSMKNYTRKQVSALSGVCPVNKLSGKTVKKHAMSRRGSKLLRKILYLDSFQAIQRMPAMKEFYNRMLSKPDSSKMSARCACMRKLLLILHAMVVNETDYNPDYKSPKIVKKSNVPA